MRGEEEAQYERDDMMWLESNSLDPDMMPASRAFAVYTFKQAMQDEFRGSPRLWWALFGSSVVALIVGVVMVVGQWYDGALSMSGIVVGAFLAVVSFVYQSNARHTVESGRRAFAMTQQIASMTHLTAREGEVQAFSTRERATVHLQVYADQYKKKMFVALGICAPIALGFTLAGALSSWASVDEHWALMMYGIGAIWGGLAVILVCVHVVTFVFDVVLPDGDSARRIEAQLLIQRVRHLNETTGGLSVDHGIRDTGGELSMSQRQAGELQLEDERR